MKDTVALTFASAKLLGSPTEAKLAAAVKLRQLRVNGVVGLVLTMYSSGTSCWRALHIVRILLWHRSGMCIRRRSISALHRLLA
jgi:hypothetical protein